MNILQDRLSAHSYSSVITYNVRSAASGRSGRVADGGESPPATSMSNASKVKNSTVIVTGFKLVPALLTAMVFGPASAKVKSISSKKKSNC